MSLRGKTGRTQRRDGRLRKHPTRVITWNHHTHVYPASGMIIRLWRTERFFL